MSEVDDLEQRGTQQAQRERGRDAIAVAALLDLPAGVGGLGLRAVDAVDADGRDAIAVVNVGDSRLYLLSEGELTQALGRLFAVAD
mgnify:CR=1 FL=1